MTKKIARLFFIFLFLLTVIVPLTYAVYYRNKILPNVFISGIEVSGKNKDEVLVLLNSRYVDLANKQFKFIYQGRNWSSNLSDMGISLDLPITVNKAYEIGRSTSVTGNISTLAKIFFQPVKIPLQVKVDELLFANTVQPIADEINSPMIPPSVNLQDKQVILISGIRGKKLDNDLLFDKLLAAIESNDYSAINLPVVNINPPYTQADEERTLQRAKNIMDKKIALAIDESEYSLSQQELIGLLSFTNGFNLEKIASLSSKLSQVYDQPPQNAAFQFDNGRVTVFKPSKDGLELDQKQSVTLIEGSLKDLEATISASTKLKLPIILSQPEIQISEINNLGLKELIGKGLSYFRGSIPSRVHNLTLASSKLNGTLIAPGETFSFNKTVGDISANTGYQQAYVIKNGRTVLGDGGGVCQVSTTLFRAALNSGLPIVERQAHAYRVAYYEQGFGAGLDATVFDPSVDLKIKNDTPAHILIQSEVDAKNSRLVFELYGTSDSRNATVSIPRIWDQVPPPEAKYEDDPTLQSGMVKQVDWAAWGAKAAFDYKVVRNGEILINKTFFSNFRPWQAVYLKGTRQ